MLIEFGLFAIFLFYSYSLTMEPKTVNSSTIVSSISQNGSSLSETGSTSSKCLTNEDAANVGFLQFVCEVFAFCDTCGQLSPVGEYADAAANL